MFRFNSKYFVCMIALLATEIVIARYAHDQLIRPYGGDYLVVIFLYCLLKSFLSWPVKQTALSVLLFSYGIEISQYFNLAHHLGLDGSKIASVIMGNYFTWIDMIAYTLGILTVLWVEKYAAHSKIS